MAAWVWIVLSVPILLYIVQSLAKKTKQLPPGPRGLPIIGHFHLLSKNPHHDLNNLAQKYGQIMYMRFGMVPTIVVSSPAAAELFLKTHDHNFATRPALQVANYISYDCASVAFAPYGQYWRDMRKLCTLELLSNAKIGQFQAMRKEQVGLLVESMKCAAKRREILDLSANVISLTRDMICLMVFGRKFGDKDMDGEKGFEGAVLEVMEVGGTFNIADYFPFIKAFDLQGLTHRMKLLSRVFDGFLEKAIDDHDQGQGVNKKTQDFVGTMMTILKSGEAGFEFGRRHVKAVLLDMLLGGLDTSSVTLVWALAELIRHPRVMKKLQMELEEVVGVGTVEESHLEKFEYLDFVVKETLRIHPILPLLLPRESMEDCIVGGFHIPKKSQILVNAWAIGRNPSVWIDPNSFYPERFIGSNIDMKGRNFELLPFGSGRRGCPGMHFGLTVVKFALAQLVHSFDWELPDGMLPNDLDMTEHFGAVVSKAKHIMAIPKYRLHE